MGIYEDFYFQQDNDPKHTAAIVKEWILYNTPHMLVTPPQNPDNPIEHLWAIIGKRLQKFNIISRANLKEKILEVWNSISLSVTEKLINNMHNRLQHIIRARSESTKYYNFKSHLSRYFCGFSEIHVCEKQFITIMYSSLFETLPI